MSVSPKLQKGLLAARKGDMKRAATMFAAVLKAEPDNADALNYAGAVQHKLGKSEHAIKLLKRSLKVNDENAQAHNNLGNVLKELGQDREAVDSYRNALDRDPLNVECLNNYGVVLRNAGRFDESISTLRQAVQIAPTMAELHHNLGRTFVAAERMVEAANCFREELELAGDWTDPVAVAQILAGSGKHEEAETLLVHYLERHPENKSAQYQLQAVRGEEVERASDQYVTAVFDGFASSFDATLARLDYSAPQLVADAVVAHCGEPKADLTILDLGCGTGLCGPLVAAFKSRLVGIDLSAEMMRRAENRGCYDALRQVELQEYLETQPPASVDVAICADTLIYLGTLERTFAGARRILRPGGLFVATVECLGEENDRDYAVDATGRFKHSQSYLERLSESNEFEIISMDEAILRHESGTAVRGYVVILRLPQ